VSRSHWLPGLLVWFILLLYTGAHAATYRPCGDDGCRFTAEATPSPVIAYTCTPVTFCVSATDRDWSDGPKPERRECCFYSQWTVEGATNPVHTDHHCCGEKPCEDLRGPCKWQDCFEYTFPSPGTYTVTWYLRDPNRGEDDYRENTDDPNDADPKCDGWDRCGTITVSAIEPALALNIERPELCAGGPEGEPRFAAQCVVDLLGPNAETIAGGALELTVKLAKEECDPPEGKCPVFPVSGTTSATAATDGHGSAAVALRPGSYTGTATVTVTSCAASSEKTIAIKPSDSRAWAVDPSPVANGRDTTEVFADAGFEGIPLQGHDITWRISAVNIDGTEVWKAKEIGDRDEACTESPPAEYGHLVGDCACPSGSGDLPPGRSKCTYQVGTTPCTVEFQWINWSISVDDDEP
jgi:hypothetical protein